MPTKVVPVMRLNQRPWRVSQGATLSGCGFTGSAFNWMELLHHVNQVVCKWIK
jgi:hypothetical protein